MLLFGDDFIALALMPPATLTMASTDRSVVARHAAVISNPGAVPPGARPTDPELGERQCRRCQTFKPERAHHCSICQRCIIKMDHHCP